MWKLAIRCRLHITALDLLAVMLITACQGAAAREVPSTGVAPIASPANPPTPVASPTPQPTPTPSPTPTVEPPPPPVVESGSANPVILPAEPGAAESVDDTSWLTAEPPADMTWQSYTGKIEAKNIAFSYQLLYPAGWFIYPNEGAVQIQTFPQFETLDQAPPGFSEGAMKIDVGFQICASPDDDCQLTGAPVVVAGLSGVAHAGQDDVSGLTIRSVALPKDKVIFRITAYIHGEPERIAAYEQILGYMLSTLRVDE